MASEGEEEDRGALLEGDVKGIALSGLEGGEAAWVGAGRGDLSGVSVKEVMVEEAGGSGSGVAVARGDLGSGVDRHGGVGVEGTTAASGWELQIEGLSRVEDWEVDIEEGSGGADSVVGGDDDLDREDSVPVLLFEGEAATWGLKLDKESGGGV